MYKALGSIPEPDKQDMVTHTCNVALRTQELEDKASKVILTKWTV